MRESKGVYKNRRLLYGTSVAVVIFVFALVLIYGSFNVVLNVSNEEASTELKAIDVNLVNVVSGDINTIGSEVCIYDECFYVIGSDAEGVKLLAKYNLHVGKVFSNQTFSSTMLDATGIQNPLSRGMTYSSGDYGVINSPWYGIVKFSDTKYWGVVSDVKYQYIYNKKSNYYEYIQLYKKYLEDLGVEVINARLLAAEEYDDIIENTEDGEECAFGGPDWLCYTTFPLGSASSTGELIWVWSGVGWINGGEHTLERGGVRPVVIISSAYF